MRILGFAVKAVAGLVSIGAGTYLVTRQSASGDTWLEVLAHGIGVFFIAAGLFMIGSAIAASAQRNG